MNPWGLKIYQNPLCVQVKVSHVIDKLPGKRRRRFRVRRVETSTPCIYQTPQGIYMHPELYRRMTQEGAS